MAPVPMQFVSSTPTTDLGEEEDQELMPQNGEAADKSLQSGTDSSKTTDVVQRAEEDVPRVTFNVYVNRPLTKIEFRDYLQIQIFGRVIHDYWDLSRDKYLPGDNPHVVYVTVTSVRLYIGQVNSTRGIETNEDGSVVGADRRAAEFAAVPGAEASAVIDEINRRY